MKNKKRQKNKNKIKFLNQKANVVACKKLEFTTEEITLTNPENIIVKIKSSAICGGDKKAYIGKHPFVDFPIALGHEFSGEIVAAGKKANNFSAGDRVVVEPAVNCGNCSNCLQGKYNFCQDLTFLYRQGKAGMAQYIEVAANKAYKLPDSLSFQEGALIEPLAVAVHAWQRNQVKFSDKVAIIGSGTIGLLLLQLALNSGVKKTTIFGISDSKLELAHELGADNVIKNQNKSKAEKLNNKYNQVFEAVGLEQTFNQALDITKPDGRVVLVGLYKNEILVDLNKAIQKELNIYGSQGYCWNFSEAIDLAASGKIKLNPLITNQFKLAEIDKALETAIDPAEEAIKVICNC